MYPGVQQAQLLKLAVCTIFMFATHNWANAQNSDPVTIVNMTTTAEFIDKQERISGGAAVGVTFFDPEDRIQLDAAYVYFADPVSAVFQLQLATVDGRFLATFENTPPAVLSGWVELKLSVSKPAFLDDYQLEEIGVLVTRAGSDAIYPVRWGKPAATETIRVLVNTEGSNSYFATFDEKKKKLVPKQCRNASRRSSFKFDRICDVPAADIRASNSIDIMRKRGPDFGSPINIVIGLSENTN